MGARDVNAEEKLGGTAMDDSPLGTPAVKTSIEHKEQYHSAADRETYGTDAYVTCSLMAGLDC
jgi:hypothetical protein